MSFTVCASCADSGSSGIVRRCPTEASRDASSVSRLKRFPPQAVQGNYADQRIADTLADSLPEYDDGFRGSAPVGSFVAGPGGFYDLGGNVAEWSNDRYAVHPGQA